MENTLGEKRVRVDFNTTEDTLVNGFKKKTADLINLCETMRSKNGVPASGEKNRLISLAMTAYEEAAMWAVKAATGEHT